MRSKEDWVVQGKVAVDAAFEMLCALDKVAPEQRPAVLHFVAQFEEIRARQAAEEKSQ